MITIRWVGSYLFMSSLAILMAFYISSGLMSRGHAQTSQSQTQAPAPETTPPAQAPEAATSMPDVLLESGSQPVQQTTVPAANPDDFNFDPTGLRDPFKPYKAFKPEKDKSASMMADVLQGLALETVELVAVIWDVNNPRAMIKDKKGSTYTLKRNTKVGRNNGVVVAIREGEVVVLESLEEDGRVIKQYVTIKMTGQKSSKLGL